MPLKTNIQNSLSQFFANRQDILCVYLFGSVARGKENKFSDVDVAVLFHERVDRAEYTERCLELIDKISHFSNREVDVVCLNAANLFIRFQILKTGLKIFEYPQRGNHTFEARTIVEFFDYLPVRRRLEESVLARIKGIKNG